MCSEVSHFPNNESRAEFNALVTGSMSARVKFASAIWVWFCVWDSFCHVFVRQVVLGGGGSGTKGLTVGFWDIIFVGVYSHCDYDHYKQA